MRVRYSYLPEQFSDFDDYADELREWVKSGEFTLGPYVEKFERKFARYIGVKHVISTNTGTDALILALKAAGIGPGDEVITVPNTFYATVGAIVAAGAKPVFVDCDEQYQIDAGKIEAAITRKTRAILPVHWTGFSPDMPRILKIAKRRKLKVIEDACPAVGATIGGRLAGSFGHINAFSMHPLKPLNVWGDGGMVATNDDAMASYLLKYRNHGMTDRDHIEFWGVNCRLQPVQAIVASRVLDTMGKIIGVRNRNAKLLDAGLRKLGGFVSVPPRPAGTVGAYQLYVACFKNRPKLMNYLIKNGVEAKIHYPVPLHLQKAAQSLGYRKGDFPVCEKQAAEIVTLPAHQYITPEQIHYTLDLIRKFYQ